MPADVGRIIALGASNLRRGFRTVVATARAAWGPGVEVLAALGHGRSYGAPIRLFFRTVPGILESGLWRENEFALPHGTATLAVARREERMDEEAGFAVTRRDTNAIVGVLQFAWSDHTLQANLRHDRSTQYGGQTTGAIALGLSPRTAVARHRELRHGVQGAVVQ